MTCFCGVLWGILETHLSSQEAGFASAQAPSPTPQAHPSLSPKHLPRITILAHQQMILKHCEYRCLPWWASG